MKLIDRLSGQLGISKKKAKALLDRRLVFVNARRVWIASFEVGPCDVIEVAGDPGDNRSTAGAGPRTLYEDENLLVIDKPAGLLSVGPGSAEILLRKTMKNREISACHRLDRDTSGVMVLAKNRVGLEKMEKLFKERGVKKTYLALVAGRVQFDQKTVDSPLEGQPSVSSFTLLEAGAEASLLEVRIATGRTHQIRKHLQGLGLHLIGEKEYDLGTVRKEIFRKAARQMLHSCSLSFADPFKPGTIEVRAEPPEDFKRIAGQAGLKISHWRSSHQ